MKFNLLKQLMFLGIILSSSIIFSQTVTGTVTGDGDSLPGVNVVVKGTTQGVTTDFDGNYSIDVADPDAVLVFSFIGFTTQEIAVNGQSVINVELVIDAMALDEVVVTGYGSQVKKEVTSSIVQLDDAEFNKGVVNNTAQLLQGKVAGLTISTRGGDPNNAGTLRLRGISTIGANTSPLVVIDGLSGGDLSSVDPSDIENISVLKDGSAAAIYGTRGSSGVILVTTKKGSSSKTGFEYNGQLEVSSIARTIDNMSAAEFRAAGGFDLGSDNDWIDEVTRTGITNVHNFAASGGIDNTNYRISANIRDVNGILENSGFDQFNTRANFNTKILNDKLSITFNTAFTRKESEFGFYEGLRYAVLFNPTAPILGADSPFQFNADQFGGYFEALGLFDSFNPVSIVNQNYNRGIQNTFDYGIKLKTDITESISAVAIYSEQHIKVNNRQYYPTTAHFRGGAANSTRKGRADFYDQERNLKLFEAYGTYTGDYDNSKLTFTAGYSYQENNFADHYLQIGDFPDNSLDFSNAIENSYDLLEAGFISANSNRSPEERLIAFFGRANFTIDDAIFLMASVRHEGSTKLGTENQWGTFPAFGVGADLNNYLDLDGVDLLKVRLGYGVTGALPNDNGLSREIRNIIYDTETGAASSTLARAANPDLKWEEKTEINLGVEFSTARFDATLDLYTRDVSDFIINRKVDVAEFGVDNRFENAGKLKTDGLELTLGYDLVQKADFTYNTGLVFSTYKSTLEEYVVDSELRANLGAPGQNSTNMILVREGEEIGQIWGPVWTGEIVDGSQVFADTNGDGVVNANADQGLAEDTDFAVLGKGIPDFEIGWTNQIFYKNWEVNAFFRGQFGHSLVNAYRAFFEPRVGTQTGYNFINTELAEPEITNAQFSSLYVEKADFFKLQNMTIGYNFDLSEKTQKYIKGINMSLTGTNLFTITNYTGNDPEASLSDTGAADNGGEASGNDVLSPGIDRRNNYFSARTFALGVTIKF